MNESNDHIVQPTSTAAQPEDSRSVEVGAGIGVTIIVGIAAAGASLTLRLSKPYVAVVMEHPRKQARSLHGSAP